ncbi:TerC family protein [Desulforamulus ruminis]|uniref:Integral membrane protein TerC n=1 Tax=Desulforamulus ruminis (strain ATCC 23193 / DSM 2154 / NCIMB 8452 / DL) TaxID=696281 RepID=F6DSW9_DESRL|nr:TerC family protein [Desulforamulus ruminis]AEG59963.1 Integral membrane protein TerC [Desulforamulus ruminis DSM 2154]
MEFFSSEFLTALLSIIVINIVLSGDNAVVIALASRKLPVDQQKKAVFWGSFAAIGLRIILTTVAVVLLKLPYVQVIGGILLIPIAVKLLVGEEEEEACKEADCLRDAIQTIVVADLLMSLDNVLAVAGVAKGNIPLLIIGLAISIPIIIFGSQIVMMLMKRFKIIVYLGAGLLGYTSGEMITGDRHVSALLHGSVSFLHWLIPVALTAFVIVMGIWLNKRQAASQEGHC